MTSHMDDGTKTLFPLLRELLISTTHRALNLTRNIPK